MKMAPPALSVCMIVKNEADNLPKALECVKNFADEIVIVDTGSSDATKEIASNYTTNVHDFEWIDDFAAARNFAMSKATGRYHLWLDADDRITPENRKHINSLKSLFDGRKAFYFVLENHQSDAPSSSCLQLRCTPLIPEVRFESPIHEQIFPSAVNAGLELVHTDIVVCHHGYMTEEARVAKAKRNLAMLERRLDTSEKKGGVYFFLALTYAPMGNREEAVRSMEAALECFQREDCNHHLIPEGYGFLAKVFFEMEDHDKCIRNLVKLKSVSNGSLIHIFQIGILYQRMGKHTEAVEAFRDASGKKFSPGLFPTQPPPNESELLLHTAYSLFCVNDRKGALELINASASDKPHPGRSWEWLGTKAFAFKNMVLAQLAFETALRFSEIEPNSWGRLAEIYSLRGFSEKARDCFRKAGG